MNNLKQFLDNHCSIVEVERLRDATSKYLCEKSLYEFLKQAWPHIEGGVEFVPSWHLEVIAEHLEACFKRDIRNLVINVPPRSSKTSLVSVCFPVWCSVHEPSIKFMYASYAKSLSLEHAIKSRRLIESNWFQSNWGNKFKLTSDQNTKSYFENDKKGYRISTSVGAAVTGSGGDILVCDDPNSASATSKVKLEAVNKWHEQVWSTRLNDPKTGVKILVQQRVRENDLTGHILSHDENKEWVHLMLPMEYEDARKSKTVVLPSTYPNIWEDPRTKEGSLLIPQRFGGREITKLKIELGSYGYAGQFQQRPSPEEGGILKRHWFKVHKGALPKLELILQSYDTAYSDKPDAAYSAVTTWGLTSTDNGIRILLLSCWRGRVGFPELRARAQRLYDNYLDIGVNKLTTKGMKINKCIIEAQASGTSLIQDFIKAGVPALSYKPKGDKTSRVQQISAYIEAGIVYYVDRPENLEFIEEVSKFPNAESRDYTDTLSQILGYLRDNNMLTMPNDPKIPETINKNKITYFQKT